MALPCSMVPDGWLDWQSCPAKSQFILGNVSVEQLGAKVVRQVSLYPEKCLHFWLCWEGA